MFKYAQVEAAIAKLHDLPQSVMGTLRARIRHYQKIGIIPSAPGRGQKIDYTPELVIAWALCTELAEAAVPPNFVRLLLKKHGYGLISFFVRQSSAKKDTYMFIKGQFMRNQILGEENYYMIGYATLATGIREYAKTGDMLRRCIIINLSDLKLRLGEALGVDWTEVEWEKPDHGWLFPPQAGDEVTH